jgi:uncharacterized protein (DUF1697 family)
MPVLIALMRSIVIARQRVLMADARGLAESVGGTDVRSVIATGNLIFRSRKGPRTLERELEAACAVRYGKATEMVVKSAVEWRALLAANPFPEAVEIAPQNLLVWAMREPIPDAGIEQLRRRADQGERIERVASGDFYIWFGPGRITDSRVVAGFGLRSLGAVGTNRNWNTCQKVASALDALEAGTG